MKESINPVAARARVHYSESLPYHNWSHARDVMDNVDVLCERAHKFGAQVQRSIMQIAAAWHDAAYHEPMDGTYPTKEERSAALVMSELADLSDQDRRIIASAIIDTTVDKTPKDSTEGVLLHFADIGYFATEDYSEFLEKLILMRAEWGDVSWDETIHRTKQFAENVIQEALHELPPVIGETETDQWVGRVENNIRQLTANANDGVVA